MSRLFHSVALLTLFFIAVAALVTPAAVAASTIPTSASITSEPSATSSPPAPPPAEEQERDSSLALFLVLLLLIFSFFASYYLRVKRITAIHETIVGLFAGCLVGIVLRLGPGQQVQSMLSFSNTIMLNVLLPPIILASGYDLRQESFFRNFGIILAFAFAGTLLSAIVIGVLVYLWSLADFTISLTIIECLIFGSTLSATDPVTILSIFNSKKVDPTLYSIIFGESLLNDAVSIVMFDTLSTFHGKNIGVYSIFHGIGLFLIVFTLSMALGVAFGLACSLMLKHSRLSMYPQLEGCLVALIAYTSYFFSNAVTMSGIVSLLFCGITLKHYAYHNMSRRTQRSTRYTFQTLASLSENFIFIYLGLSLFTQENLVFKPLFILVTVASVVFSRYAAVFPIASLINFIRRLRRSRGPTRTQNRGSSRHEELSRDYQIMLFWAGLRGAVGFALSAGIVGENALALQTTVLVTIVLTLLVFGGTTPQMLDILGIRTGVQDDEGDSSDEDEDFGRYGDMGMGSRQGLDSQRGPDLVAERHCGRPLRANGGRSGHLGVKRRGGYTQGLYRDDEALFHPGVRGSKNGVRYSYEEDVSDSSDVLPTSRSVATQNRGSSSSLPTSAQGKPAEVTGMGAGCNVHGVESLFSSPAEEHEFSEDEEQYLGPSFALPDGGSDLDLVGSDARRESAVATGNVRARALLEQGALIMRDGQWFQRIDDRYLKPYFSNAVASRKHQQRKNARQQQHAAATVASTSHQGAAPLAANAVRLAQDEDGTAALWEAEAASREPDAENSSSGVLDEDEDVAATNLSGTSAGGGGGGGGKGGGSKSVSGAFT